MKQKVTSDEESISSDLDSLRGTPKPQRKETDPNRKFSKDQVINE